MIAAFVRAILEIAQKNRVTNQNAAFQSLNKMPYCKQILIEMKCV